MERQLQFDVAKIQHIEDELQVTLPDAYRNLLLSFPLNNDPYDWDVFGHINTIIGENKTYREFGFFGPVWPSQYLIVGSDGFGNLFFLDLSRGDDVVFFADHEATSDLNKIDMYEETLNLSEWIIQMKEEKAAVELEEERNLTENNYQASS